MSFTIDQLRTSLSSDSKVLSIPEHEEFQESMLRWTDLDLKIPQAIVLPASEEDCHKAVSLIKFFIFAVELKYLGSMGSECFDTIRCKERRA